MNNKMKGIYRVIIAVYDMEKAEKFFTDLLGGVFYKPDCRASGEECWINPDAGIELLSPYPAGTKGGFSGPWLEKHGESIMGVVFNPENLEEAVKNAEAMGVKPFMKQFIPEEKLKELFALPGHPVAYKRYDQYFFEPEDTYNTRILFSDYERNYD